MVSAWLAAVLGASAVAVLVPGPRRRPQGVAEPIVLAWCAPGRDRGTDAAGGRPTPRPCWRSVTSSPPSWQWVVLPAPRCGRPAELWPPLGPVVEAFHLGADVPAALRSLARERPGAADLRLVAGAWQVAHHSGHGLAAALSRTSRGIRARRRTRRLVDSELASARATARLVALLPLVVLLMGSGAGSDPWGFLLTTPIGLACLASGLGLIGLGLWWIERLADAAAGP